MSDVKLCDCCGREIGKDDAFHALTFTTDAGDKVLDICNACLDVIVELPLAPIRKVRRQRKAKTSA